MRPRMSRAFGLIELLCAISIVVLLLAISLPALSGARERAKFAACGGNLSQISLCLFMYADEHKQNLFVTRYPSRSRPPLVYFPDALATYCLPPQVFHCPSDRGGPVEEEPDRQLSYFQTEKSSYWYRNTYYPYATFHGTRRCLNTPASAASIR